jgi:very-short-patch-repair endonuclease
VLLVGERWLEVDCLWRREGVLVELDGRDVHDTVRAFERDRARDRALTVAGWRVVRVTWRQLEGEAGALASDLRMVLSCRPGPG